MPINDNITDDIDEPATTIIGQEMSNNRFRLSFQKGQDT